MNTGLKFWNSDTTTLAMQRNDTNLEEHPTKLYIKMCQIEREFMKLNT
jgi:hypothetical protein